MDGGSLEHSPSPAALAIGDAGLLPEPDWIRRAADEEGYAWARTAWQRASREPGAWFDSAKADEVVKRWPKTFNLVKGRFAGKPFHLRFWQEVIVRLLVGWKVPIEVINEETGEAQILWVRLYRELRLWIARKNGKSEFLAALALLFWAIEGEVRGEGFVFARDEAQAKIVFDKMADMVGYAPALAKHVSVFAKSLWVQSLKSPFKLLSGKALGKQGKGASVTVGDEMHEWKSRELADALRQGEGGSTQPIRLYASTASLKSQIVGHELYEEGIKILEGRVDDPTILVVVFAVPETDDWRDETNWPKANPSLGASPTLAFLRAEYRLTIGSPRAEASFRAFHCNQFVDQYARWLPLSKWDLCKSSADAWKRWHETDELDGRDCVLSFDSTKNFDFASLCARFEPIEDGEKVKFLYWYWLPSETIEQRTVEENVGFDRWAIDRAITPIPGGVFELDYAISAVRQAHRRFNVTCIGYDPWNALEFYNQLVNPRTDDEALSEDLFHELRFGTKTLGPASRKFEKRVFSADMDHGNHPVTRWMAGHCHIRFDENMNFVPAKKKTEKSIDGIMTSVMNEALALEQVGISPSVYETRGLLEVDIHDV